MIWFGWVLWHINFYSLFNAKSSLYIYIKYIWFGWVGLGLVLWHINLYRLFNAKSSLYIYIRYVWFGLAGFYGTTTIVGYLMLNPLYIYILNIYDLVWLGMIWFGWVWWHINYCRLFNAKSCLYIKYMISKYIFVDNIFKWAWAHFLLHIVKWFQVLQNNIPNLMLVICLHPIKWSNSSISNNSI